MRGLQLTFWKKVLRDGKFDRTIFIHRYNSKLLMTQIYVDNIVFGATSSDFVLNFVEEMKK